MSEKILDEKSDEEMILALTDIFDLLIEDAYTFAEDLRFSVEFLPFASAFTLLIGPFLVWLNFYVIKNTGLFPLIIVVLSVCLFTFSSYVIIKKYFNLKKKYSKIFDIKKELDEIKRK